MHGKTTIKITIITVYGLEYESLKPAKILSLASLINFC
jgi:hypothetical protein